MKIVLAYSGGLDTTVAIKWLSETFHAEVISVSVDVGQKDDFKKIEERAYKAGSAKHYLVDAKREFAENFALKDIKMNGLYEEVYPLATALARPLIAEKVAEVAKKEGTEYVAHGSTSKGNDQVRFDLALKTALDNVKIIAPARIWKMTREDEIAYARERGIPIKTESSKYSIDENLWGRSIEGDIISDPASEVPEDAFEWTAVRKQDKLKLSVEFEKGVPVRVNGEKLDPVKLISLLNEEVGSRGFGRVEHLENRVVGFKSREVYEAPAALALIAAHKDLEKTVLTPLELRFKRHLDSLWSDLVYQGLWYEPLRNTLELAGDEINKWVSGEVKLEVDLKSLRVVGRTSPYSPYSEKISSYNKGWYPSDEEARGFIEIWGNALPTNKEGEVWLMLYRKWGSKEDKVVTYTSSSREDVRILDKVKEVMKAHVIELFLSGNLSKEDARKLLQGINSFTKVDPSYEDVHEALEDHLIKTAGEAGGSIGLGRSRNDHVAAALRLEIREELMDLLEQLLDFRKMILKRAEENVNTPFVVYTHFQPAQPTTFGHYLLYVEEEVASRWSSIFRTLDLVNRSPLGSGAIVGTSVKLNRDRESNLLGFREVLVNTISATSSRADLISAVMEVVNLMLALSRVVEDMILLSSKFVGILELPDTHVSTSSLMPQKRNAVTMEVLRARVSRVLGYLTSITSTYKSLPSGYNLDLQEINPLFWEIIDETRTGVEVLHDLLSKVKVNEFKMDKEVLSTDEAEILAEKGMRYRDAYFAVAKAVREGKFSPTITPEQSIHRKAVKGSPNPERVREGISLARERLNGDENLLREYKNWTLKGEGELRLMENDILQEGN